MRIENQPKDRPGYHTGTDNFTSMELSKPLPQKFMVLTHKKTWKTSLPIQNGEVALADCNLALHSNHSHKLQKQTISAHFQCMFLHVYIQHVSHSLKSYTPTPLNSSLWSKKYSILILITSFSFSFLVIIHITS